MKKIFLPILTLLLTTFLATGVANARHVYDIFADKGHDEVLTASDVYIPSGFDANSDVFVVVRTMLRNSCYTFKGVSVERDDHFNHNVRLVANVEGDVCLMVTKQVNKEVRLGYLPAGTHTLRLDNGDGTYFEKSFTVEEG